MMLEIRRRLPILLTFVVLVSVAVACSTDEADDDTATSSAPGDGGATGSTSSTAEAADDVTTTVGPAGGAVATEVDLDSLTVSSEGAWGAQGLVTNPGERDETVAVTASLFDASGAIVTTVTGEALVAPVRGGESAPFVIESDLPVAEVGQVLWGVVAVPGDDGVSRDFDFATYWERGVGDERVVDMYLYTDPPGGDRAYLLFGSVENVGERAVADVEVVVAWLDAGRVVATQAVEAGLGDRSSLEPGAAADWLVVSPPDASSVPRAGLETRYWGVGS